MGRLDGKVAIITGGAGEIGAITGRLFVREGAKVLLADIAEESLKKLVGDVGNNAMSYFVGDIARPEDNEAVVQAAVERYGGVNVFLGNAGIEGMVKEIVDYPFEMLQRVLSINLMGPWLGVKAVVPEMARQGGGSIVLTSSVAGIMGFPGLSAYVMSKHGVVGLMRTAALELAPLGIRVNTVNPAPVETRMMRAIEEQSSPQEPQQVKSAFEQDIPFKRYARPEEIANLMLFLASDESSFCSGGVYTVDGAMTAD